MKSSKKLSNFAYKKVLEDKEASGAFSHAVNKYKKKLPKALEGLDVKDLPQKYKNIWYAKAVKEKKIAYLEVVAQELFRLFIPRQPKTRIIVDEQHDKLYVASKEIPEFKPILEDKLKENILSDKTTGLGEITLLSMFLNEIDLKNGNLGLDQNNQIIKIDGDWCFARLSGENGKYDISENEIKQLPMPAGYGAWNWLGATVMGVNILHKKIIDFEISTHTLFREEVNKTLMKVLVLPDELFKRFVDTYVDDQSLVNEMYTEIISRKEQLKKAALQSLSFKDYCQSSISQKLLHVFIHDLKQFKTTKKNFIIKKQDNKAIQDKVELINKTAIEKKTEIENNIELDKQLLGSSSTKINLWLQDPANNNPEKVDQVITTDQVKQKSRMFATSLNDQQKSIEETIIENFNSLKTIVAMNTTSAEQKIPVSGMKQEDLLHENEELTSEERVILAKILEGKDESDDLVISNNATSLEKILAENDDEDLVISNRTEKLTQLLEEKDEYKLEASNPSKKLEKFQDNESVEATESDELKPPVLKRQSHFQWNKISEDSLENKNKSKEDQRKPTYK